MTMDARTSSVETRAFHIIQAVVLNHSSRSPVPRSQLKAWFFRCSSRIPPWPCTIALGGPVVPEEYRMNSGWSGGPGVNARSAGGGPAGRGGGGGADLRHLRAAAHGLAAVAVAGDGEQHRRPGLGEPVDDAAGAELGRTG